MWVAFLACFVPAMCLCPLKAIHREGKKGGGPLHGVTWTHQEILFSVTSWAAALVAAVGAQDIPGDSASPPWKRTWQLSAFWKRVGTCAGVPARRHRLWLEQASFQWVLLLQSLGRCRKSPAKPCPLFVLARGCQGGLSCSWVLPVHPLHWGPHLSLSFLAGAGEGDGGRWRRAHEEQPQCVSPGWAQQSPFLWWFYCCPDCAWKLDFMHPSTLHTLPVPLTPHIIPWSALPGLTLAPAIKWGGVTPLSLKTYLKYWWESKPPDFLFWIKPHLSIT